MVRQKRRMYDADTGNQREIFKLRKNLHIVKPAVFDRESYEIQTNNAVKDRLLNGESS